jgi:exosortase family protein XrtF
MIRQFRELSPLKAFLFKAVALFVIWQALYSFWLGPSAALDDWLTLQVALQSVDFLQLLGKNSYLQTEINRLILEGQGAVYVTKACNGLSLGALFIGFIFSAPGRWWHKAVFILVGSLLIFYSNVLRVGLLAINYIKNPETFDFNHKYTYALAVYALVFLLWMIWVNRFTNVTQKPEKHEAAKVV